MKRALGRALIYLSQIRGVVSDDVCGWRGLSGAAVFTAGRTGAVTPNEVSVRVHRTRVGTVFGGGGGGNEQRPTADDGHQRAGDHCGSRSWCPCSVYRGSASRQPFCRRVGVRVTLTRQWRCRCVNRRFPHHPSGTYGDYGGPVQGRLRRDELRTPFWALKQGMAVMFTALQDRGYDLWCHRYRYLYSDVR